MDHIERSRDASRRPRPDDKAAVASAEAAEVDPSATPRRRRDSGATQERLARAFVLAVLSALLLLALFIVRRYGSKTPYYDDWNFVPYVAGLKPVTASWLWEQYADHRYP